MFDRMIVKKKKVEELSMMDNNNYNNNYSNSDYNNNYNGVIAPETTPNINANTNMGNEKKKGKGGIVLLIVLVLLLALGGGLYFYWDEIFNTKESTAIKVYENAINNTYELLSKAMKSNRSREFELDFNKPYTLGLNVTLNSSMAELRNFSGLKYGVNVGVDMAKEKAIFGASINDTSSTIINVLAYYANSNVYFKSEQLIDKVFKVGTSDLFEEIGDLQDAFSDYDFDIEDLEYVLEAYKNILINSLDESKITISDENITLSSQEYKAKKYGYTLDRSGTEQLINSLINGMLRDDKLMDIFVKITNQDRKVIEEALNKELNDLDFTGFETIIINLYADNEGELLAGNVEEASKEVVNFELVDSFKMTIVIDGDSLVIKEEKDYYTISYVYKDSGFELGNLKIYKSDKDFKMDYEFYVNGVKVNGSLGFSNIKQTATKLFGEFDFSFNMSFMGEKIDIALNGDYSLEAGDIKTLDTSNSVKIEDLTEEDQMEIYTKMMSILDRFGLEDFLGLGSI